MTSDTDTQQTGEQQDGYVGEPCSICGDEITHDWVYVAEGAAHPTCAEEFSEGMPDV